MNRLLRKWLPKRIYECAQKYISHERHIIYQCIYYSSIIQWKAKLLSIRHSIAIVK
jgi:hypothetical protein